MLLNNLNSSLFSKVNLLPYDGQLYLWRAFYSSDAADYYFNQLSQGLDWQTERLFLFGRWVLVPRLMAWYGDSNAVYRYSGLAHQPLAWIEPLLSLKQDMEAVCQHSFNSVLANLYRDGRDSMGCHADNEAELGQQPLIASLSFGETRLLRFRHNHSAYKMDIELKSGDLLVMAGSLQDNWRHELPKTRQAKQARINLTFRQILHSDK